MFQKVEVCQYISERCYASAFGEIVIEKQNSSKTCFIRYLDVMLLDCSDCV